MSLAEDCGVQMEVIRNVGLKGALTLCPKNNAGEIAPEAENFSGSKWLIVTRENFKLIYFGKTAAQQS